MRDEDHNGSQLWRGKHWHKTCCAQAKDLDSDLVVSKSLHDKWISGADASDQAGVKGGRCIALHSHTLMETGIHTASSLTSRFSS